jgi:hypothetical protein
MTRHLADESAEDAAYGGVGGIAADFDLLAAAVQLTRLDTFATPHHHAHAAGSPV